ncbi:unnamed protein product [Nippostrongylus brasiliensis]|uniref:Ovule protein n=1 Tax=Nippostrongylus brasiliensis TaxID=27835 RepID=A0A0N4YGK6_NIPBR|nr:unnamed protein product [Nippostrongylus brasiliensis]
MKWKSRHHSRQLPSSSYFEIISYTLYTFSAIGCSCTSRRPKRFEHVLLPFPSARSSFPKNSYLENKNHSKRRRNRRSRLENERKPF